MSTPFHSFKKLISVNKLLDHINLEFINRGQFDASLSTKPAVVAVIT